MKIVKDYIDEINLSSRYYLEMERIINQYLKNDISINLINYHDRGTGVIKFEEVIQLLNDMELQHNNGLTIINWAIAYESITNSLLSDFLSKRNICSDSPFNIIEDDQNVIVEISGVNVALFIKEYNILYLPFDCWHKNSDTELFLLQQILINLTSQLNESNIFKSEYLQLQEAKEIVCENKEEIKYKQNNISEKIKKDNIIKQMISLVDIERFKKLLAIAGSSNEVKKMPSKEIVNKYLHRWANAKYEYFIMFNNNFYIEKEFSYNMDDVEMASMIESLCYEFPKYAAILDRISTNEYIENKLNHDTLFEKYSSKSFQSGIKVSKFLSSYLEDEKFDLELSKVMQNRIIKGKIKISIDPYDYLMMSLNSHDWKSCHRITDGEYATGAFSYLCDEATLIAYRDNNKTYNYNYYGFKFSGNSKSWRQCIYFDKSSCSMIFGRQYPDEINEVSNEARLLLEEVVSNYIKEKNEWKISNGIIKSENYEDLSNMHYSDVDNGFDYKFARLKTTDVDNIHIKVGSIVRCVYCGKELSMHDDRIACKSCY